MKSEFIFNIRWVRQYQLAATIITARLQMSNVKNNGKNSDYKFYKFLCALPKRQLALVKYGTGCGAHA